MTYVLWVLQIMLAWLCIAGGVFQMFKVEYLGRTVISMRALPRRLWNFWGAIGFLCGLGLILPGASKLFTIVTPISAVVVVIQSVIVSGVYFYYRDFSPIIYSIAMALMGGVIAYGRFFWSPLLEH